MSRVKLIAFGAVALPIYNPRLQGGTVATREVLMALADGSAYDAYGGDQAPPDLPYPLRLDVTALEDTQADLQTAVAALYALRGKRDRLFRRRLDTGEVQFAWARLMQVPTTSGVGGLLTHLPLSFVWSVRTQWKGHDHTEWVLDDGEYLDEGLYLDDAGFTESMTSSPHIITVSNGGSTPVRGVIITLAAGDVQQLTTITIACGNADFDWTGSILGGDSLVIDCGGKSVKNDGVDAYTYFDYGANHTIDGWLELAPGDNNITVTYSLGAGTNTVDPTVTVEFQDGWE